MHHHSPYSCYGFKLRNCHVCQDAHNSLVRARAALKYIVLALSGHMDDILGKYKVLNLLHMRIRILSFPLLSYLLIDVVVYI